MDYYQSVVVEYLRADRAVFVNTECCIQLEPGENPDTSGPHWYCDAIAVDFGSKPTPTVFLCEISYADGLGALVDRLRQWAHNWAGVRRAVARECRLPDDWPVRPWFFVRRASIPKLIQKLNLMTDENGGHAFQSRITHLEAVQPWNYHSWQHRDCETEAPPEIPKELRSLRD